MTFVENLAYLCHFCLRKDSSMSLLLLKTILILYIFLYMFNYHDLATSLDKSFLKGNVITSIVVIQITSCRVLKNLRYEVNLNIGAHNVNLGIFTVMTLL